MSHKTVSPLRTNAVAIQSSVLKQVAYDEERAALHLTFHDGATYQYLSVPPHIYWELLSAESKGVYFNRRIRNAFRSIRLDDALVNNCPPTY